KKPLFVFHVVVYALLWVLCIFLMVWPFSVPLFVAILAVICLIIYFVIVFSKKAVMPVLLTSAFFTVIGVNVFLSTAFYPNVLKFQLGNDAAFFMKEQKTDPSRVLIYGIHEGRAFHFYGKHIFPEKRALLEIDASAVVITSKDSLPVFQNHFPVLKVLHEGPAFGVTALSLPFLNPATRDKEVPKYLLIALDGKP
ncbi:MAG: hypothetical protein ABIS69_01660, partial [Sediminibacterium sp.]